MAVNEWQVGFRACAYRELACVTSLRAQQRHELDMHKQRMRNVRPR